MSRRCAPGHAAVASSALRGRGCARSGSNARSFKGVVDVYLVVNSGEEG